MIDFDSAMHFAQELEVTQDGTVIGKGIILSHSSETIKIGNEYFVKDACEFRIVTVFN